MYAIYVLLHRVNIFQPHTVHFMRSDVSQRAREKLIDDIKSSLFGSERSVTGR